MTDNLTRFEPDWTSPPGETIADLLDEKGWTQTQLALRTGFTKKHINDLIRGKASISPDTALRLESALGGKAGFWLNREAQYREAVVREESESELENESDWLRELPLAHMARFGWIQRIKTTSGQVAECLRFFGVSSVDAWRHAYVKPLAAFRKDAKASCPSVGPLSAWLRQGEREAERLHSQPFTEDSFRAALARIRTLTNDSDPKSFIPSLEQTCAACGVAVVFVPPPPKCAVFGATRWLSPDRALLQLSLRYKTNDQLWFTFFHEAGHILLHGKKLLFLEGTETTSKEQEEEANRFATGTLVPNEFDDRLTAVRGSHAAVTTLARDLGIAPGILVGRLQKEGKLPWSHLNDLKIRYCWTEEP